MPSGGRTLWQDDFLFDAYELAKEGTKEKALARILGISFPTLLDWERKKPLFALALKRGRKLYRARRARNNNGVSEIEEYYFNRLSPEERKVWKKIQRANRAKTGLQTLNAILEGRGKVFRQHLLLHAIIHNNFAITKACRMVGISLTAFDLWKRQDPAFLQMFKTIEEAKKDLFEQSMLRLAKVNETAVVIHAAKTLCRDRGYGEKQEIDVNVSGQVNHNIVQIDVEALPLEVRKLLLEEVRKVKQVESQVINTVPQLPAPAKVKNPVPAGFVAFQEARKLNGVRQWDSLDPDRVNDK
jgi:hypothetical protein